MEEWRDEAMKSKKGSISLIVVGSILALGPLWGLLGTVIGMIRAFLAAGQTDSTPAHLASNISVSLWATAAGLIVLPIGIAMLVGGIIWLSRIGKSTNCP